MRTKRMILGAVVACLVLAAGCGQTQMDKDRREARRRWADSRAEMMTKLAEGCYRRGNLDRAREHVEEIIKGGVVRYAPVYVLGARLAAEKGELDLARDYAETATTIDPKSAEACYVLGTIDQAIGHDDKALEEFATAAELSPDVARYVLAESEMLVAAGQPETAAKRLATAAQRMPGRADIHGALADVFSLLGRYQEAVGSYRISMRLDPKGQTPTERFASALFHSGAYQEAEGVLVDLEALEPDFAAGWIGQMRADCLLALGRTDQARALYQQRSRDAPETARPLVSLAKCDIVENRLPSARKFLDAALSRSPQAAEANALMGYVLVAEGRPGEALPHLQLALKDPNCAGRDTVVQLLIRAGGQPPEPPPATGPPAAAPHAERSGPYSLARPISPS